MPRFDTSSESSRLSDGSGAHDDAQHRRRRSSKKRRRDAKVGEVRTETNGHGSSKKRRHSLSNPARDPRDDPNLKKTAEKEEGQEVGSRLPSPVIDFDGLSRPSLGTRKILEETDEEREARMQKMKGAVRTILECVGEDPDREGLLATPGRFAKAMLDFTGGYQQNVRDIINDAIFHEGHDEMVIIKDIEIFSLCEHHLVPFTGKMHIGYIPSSSVIGLSKLPRIAEMFARRLQIQERLTKEVATAVMEILKPQGVAVVMESSHLCMVMRGVQKTSAKTTTSCVLGCFRRRSKTRQEFFNLLGLR